MARHSTPPSGFPSPSGGRHSGPPDDRPLSPPGDLPSPADGGAAVPSDDGFEPFARHPNRSGPPTDWPPRSDDRADPVGAPDPGAGAEPSAPETAWQDTAKPPGKAGRNLPAAIGVGLVLGAVVLASLLIDRRAFLLVIAVALTLGVWELSSALRRGGIGVPTWPLVGAGLGMIALTWFGGPPMLVLGLGVTVVVLAVWRLADGATGYQVDLPASVLVASYVPFLGGFAVMMLLPDDGHLRIIATLATAVLSDTGGYVAGVFFGRHPMAPRISPKKSWEGMAGSLLACAIGGALLLHFMFGVAWWWGAAFGATVAVAATLGDLTESLIKRDLGVKDMSKLIPGHGGLMDRLDSILVVLPVAFAWLSFLAPTS